MSQLSKITSYINIYILEMFWVLNLMLSMIQVFLHFPFVTGTYIFGIYLNFINDLDVLAFPIVIFFLIVYIRAETD